MSALTDILARSLPGLRVRRLQGGPRRDVLLGILLVAALAAMAAHYLSSQRQVTVRVDGRSLTVRTHHEQGAAILRQAGVELAAADLVEPGLEEHVPAGGVLTVRRGRPVSVWADGRRLELRTQATQVGQLLEELDLRLKGGDRLLVNGSAAHPADPLPSEPAGTVHLAVVRSTSIRVADGVTAYLLATSAATVGEALRAAGVWVYPEDRIYPGLEAPVHEGLSVQIARARPLTVLADGRSLTLRTHLPQVLDVLAELGLRMGPLDYLNVEPTARVQSGMVVELTRVEQVTVKETRAIAYVTRWEADPELELDQSRLVQPGQEGVFAREWVERYENGELVDRRLAREWVEREPVPEVHRFGTQIVMRQLETPEGPLTYWRAIRMRATSYTAATSGKTRDHPAYGITRMGLAAGKGIVAVDPRVVSLGTRLYVPGYGLALAGDTGGRILGRRVDLGYDEDNLVLWNSLVTVYLLPPVPDRINYVLP